MAHWAHGFPTPNPRLHMVLWVYFTLASLTGVRPCFTVPVIYIHPTADDTVASHVLTCHYRSSSELSKIFVHF